MNFWTEMALTIMCSVLASSGLWAMISKQMDRKDAKTELLMGIAHDRIIFLGMSYVNRGYITQDEYENLYNYLYEPYKKIGNGNLNSTADRIMKEVERLPIRRGDSAITAKLG